MRFEHRATEADRRIVDRVWRTRSDADATMTSTARTSVHLILARTEGRLAVGLRGPETMATSASVPADTEYLGVRFAVGVAVRPHSAAALVNAYLPLPVTEAGAIVIGGVEFEPPSFDNVEQFVRRLVSAGVLVPSILDPDTGSAPGGSARTRQRRHRAITGMTRSAVVQIDRTNAAATLLRGGTDWASVVDSLGFFDQAHLARALRRFLGRTVGEVRAGEPSPMSFLYKTPFGVGS